jgi:hypothetical protein
LAFYKTGRGSRICPLAAGDLERVEAESYIVSFRSSNNVPNISPGGGVSRPTPVFVGKTISLLSKQVGEFGYVTD